MNYIKRCRHLSFFLAIVFVACFFWYWIHPVQQVFHLQFLQSAFFGFTAMNFGSFIFGLIQSYIYGIIFTAFWDLAGYISRCCRK